MRALIASVFVLGLAATAWADTRVYVQVGGGYHAGAYVGGGYANYPRPRPGKVCVPRVYHRPWGTEVRYHWVRPGYYHCPVPRYYRGRHCRW